MNKFFSALIALCMLISATTLVGCGMMASKKLKLGLGVYTTVEKTTDADGELNGKGQLSSTVAAVLVDEDGVIVKCKLDCADNTAEYTADGKFVPQSNFKTKNELGEDYGMKKLAGSDKEWFEQAEAFANLAIGKKLDNISELVAEGGKGSADVIEAGCTVDVSDFVKAIEKAVVAAKDSSATAKDEIQISVKTALVGKDAADNSDGYSQFDMTFTASAGGNTEENSRSMNESVKFTFNEKGEALSKS